LVIDCNRPLHVPSSIAKQSEHVVIPGNHGVSDTQVERRINGVFRPYHACIEAELARRERERQPTIFIALHSFTPTYMGILRPWQAGVLYNRDARLARMMLASLRSEADLIVGDNEPYSVSDLSDYGIIEYGERRGLPHVELEIRQDLIADDAGQRAWAERLARLLPEAACALTG
jgi:predicted N-formylglutamate amidohydrolase